MPVREFVKSDVAEVVTLYWNYMAERTGPVPLALVGSFAELYFSNPLSDASPSFVYHDASGEILGFMGVTTRTMLLSGRSIRVGFAGNFLVHPKARSGVAAPGLLSAYIAGDQDLLITDTANDISRHLFQRLRFQTIPELNIHWARPIRPCHYVMHALGRVTSPSLSTALRLSTKPFCVVADRLAGRMFPRPPQSKTSLRASEMTVEALLDCLIESRKGCILGAEYGAEQLRWLLRFMTRNHKRGTLRSVILRDDGHKTVGWYLYYAKRGGIGEVVQTGGSPALFKEIFTHLFRDAREQEVIALHGRADFCRLPDLSDLGCFFTCRGGWTLAFSGDPEIMRILRSGRGSLSRLDGEWCLDPGE
jgi:hypothetical protein